MDVYTHVLFYGTNIPFIVILLN